MNPTRFSPIASEARLREAIAYTHSECFKLCKKVFGSYLLAAGNIGIFCHDDGEYKFLTKIRKEWTDASDHWNGKYFRLHDPLTFPSQDDIPETVYTHLYIRKPDHHQEVGDVDFVLGKKEYAELRVSLAKAIQVQGMEILNRPDLDLIKLSDPEFDVLSFIGSKSMAENMGGAGEE